MIDLDSVSFVRDGRTILSQVSWHVDRGQHWALVGANGAGKTTLLEIVCGTQWPTEGHVHVLGEDYGDIDLRDHRRRIGWFSTALEQKISRREAVRDLVTSGKFATLGLVFDRPSRGDYRRADELLEFMDATVVARQRFDTLSQGERQKVLLCRALMAEPELLILDEPCTGLDVASRERFLESVDRLAGRRGGPGLIVVTHHVEEIVPAVSHVLVLARGRVAACGPKAEVLRSKVLSQALGVSVRVSHRKDRYWLSLT
jgi:iron complex transport system ATP-binding protein